MTEPGPACIRTAAAGLLAAALGGCASTPPDAESPRPLGREVALRVVTCETRVGDIEARLGAPDRDGRSGTLRVVTWIVEWEPLSRYLGVAVDTRGLVVDRVWDLPTEVPWVPTDRCGSR